MANMLHHGICATGHKVVMTRKKISDVTHLVENKDDSAGLGNHLRAEARSLHVQEKRGLHSQVWSRNEMMPLPYAAVAITPLLRTSGKIANPRASDSLP